MEHRRDEAACGPLDHRAGGFGRHVPWAKAGAPRCEHESSALVGLRAQGRLDGGLVVGHDPHPDAAAWEQGLEGSGQARACLVGSQAGRSRVGHNENRETERRGVKRGLGHSVSIGARAGLEDGIVPGRTHQSESVAGAPAVW
jgi:hypothetical protein